MNEKELEDLVESYKARNHELHTLLDAYKVRCKIADDRIRELEKRLHYLEKLLDAGEFCYG